MPLGYSKGSDDTGSDTDYLRTCLLIYWKVCIGLCASASYCNSPCVFGKPPRAVFGIAAIVKR